MVSVSCFVFLLGVAITILVMWRKKQKRWEKEATYANLTTINDVERKAGPKMFSYGELVLATNNFSEGRRLGQGGFGVVCRGYIIDLDATVAVKKVSQ